MTGYDKDGYVLEFGMGGMDTIFKHLYRADKINSKMNKKKKDGSYDKNHKSRKNMRRRMKTICCKVKI
jgi:hypothetical protein